MSAEPERLDLGAGASVVDPAGYFARHRQSGDVVWSEVNHGWAVIGHAAVAEAFRDSDLLSADRVSVLERASRRQPDDFGAVVDLLRGWMIFRDPPVHTRLREPVRSAFTPRRVAELETTVRAVVDRAIEQLVRADGDVAEHLGRPVPALVIGALLGVDPADRPRLQAWSDELASIVFSVSPSTAPAPALVRAARSFHDFFGALVERERGSDGIVGRIAELEGTFDTTELVGLCTLLLFAGHETTTGLIMAMTGHLAEDPTLAARLRETPALRPGAVEEFVRVIGPARTMARKAKVDHDRAGAPVRAGDTVFLSIAAANHDERVFDLPGDFDPTRDPNPHLGFGWGLHHCLGAGLARLEGLAVLDALLDRLPEIRAPDGVPPLSGNVMGLARAPFRLDTRWAR